MTFTQRFAAVVCAAATTVSATVTLAPTALAKPASEFNENMPIAFGTLVTDLTGDGIPDKVVAKEKGTYDAAKKALTCTTTYDKGNDGSVDHTFTYSFDSLDPDNTGCPHRISTQDFQGDGTLGLALLNPSTMGSFFANKGLVQLELDGTMIEHVHTGKPMGEENVYFMDVNGDARTDMIMASSLNFQVLLSSADGVPGRGPGTGFILGQPVLAPVRLAPGSSSTDLLFIATDVTGKPSDSYGLYALRGGKGPAELLIKQRGDSSVIQELTDIADVDGDGDVDVTVKWSGLPGKPTDVFINDGSGHFTVQGASNPAPIARDDRVYMTYGTHEVGTIDVKANDLHAKRTDISVTTRPRIGRVWTEQDGRLRYDRRGKGAGDDELTYTITDGAGRTSTATLRIVMRGTAPGGTPTTPAPFARDDRVKMTYGSHEQGDIPVLGNDLHVEGATLTVTKPPRHGVTGITVDRRIRYARNPGAVGNDELEYTVTDAHGRTSTATLRIDMQGTPVDGGDNKPVGAAPLAWNDHITMTVGRFERGDINVLRNDPSHQDVRVTVTKAPRVGKATVLDSGRIRYDRRGKGSAADAFEYTITDGQGRTSTAKVTISMKG